MAFLLKCMQFLPRENQTEWTDVEPFQPPNFPIPFIQIAQPNSVPSNLPFPPLQKCRNLLSPVLLVTSLLTLPSNTLNTVPTSPTAPLASARTFFLPATGAVEFINCWIRYPLIVLPEFSSAYWGHVLSSEQETVGGQQTPTLLSQVWQRGLSSVWREEMGREAILLSEVVSEREGERAGEVSVLLENGELESERVMLEEESSRKGFAATAAAEGQYER